MYVELSMMHNFIQYKSHLLCLPFYSCLSVNAFLWVHSKATNDRYHAIRFLIYKTISTDDIFSCINTTTCRHRQQNLTLSPPISTHWVYLTSSLHNQSICFSVLYNFHNVLFCCMWPNFCWVTSSTMSFLNGTPSSDWGWKAWTVTTNRKKYQGLKCKLLIFLKLIFWSMT